MWSLVSCFKINIKKNCRRDGSNEIHIYLLMNSPASLNCVTLDKSFIIEDELCNPFYISDSFLKFLLESNKNYFCHNAIYKEIEDDDMHCSC